MIALKRNNWNVLKSVLNLNKLMRNRLFHIDSNADACDVENPQKNELWVIGTS